MSQFRIHEGGQLFEHSDAIYQTNLGEVRSGHEPNQTDYRKRGYGLERFDGVEGDNYWKQPSHLLSEEPVPYVEEIEEWTPPGMEKQVLADDRKTDGVRDLMKP